MKKLLLTLTAAGVLVVPVGLVAAQDDTTEPTTDDPAPTAPVQERDRERIQDPDGDMPGPGPMGHHGESNGQGNGAGNGPGDGECDGDCDGQMFRERNQFRAEGEPDEPMKAQERNQARVEEGSGDGQMFREENRIRVEGDPDEPVQLQERAQHCVEDPDEDATSTRERTRAAESEETPDPAETPEVDVEHPDDGAQLQFQYGADGAAGRARAEPPPG